MCDLVSGAARVSVCTQSLQTDGYRKVAQIADIPELQPLSEVCFELVTVFVSADSTCGTTAAVLLPIPRDW